MTNDSNKSFRVVSLQIDNTLILAGNIFAIIKEKKLNEVKLLAKKRENRLMTPL